MRRIMMWTLCWTLPIALCADGNGGGIGVQTIKVSSVSPLLMLKFWDYEAEDGDWVRIVVDGETYREFELKNAPKTVAVPILFSDKDEVFVNVIGTRSGNGPVTYAVQATGLGSSMEVYKNYANVGSGNSYRIVKTKDDIFSVGVGYVAGLFGTGLPKRSALSEEQKEKLQEELQQVDEALSELPSIPKWAAKSANYVHKTGLLIGAVCSTLDNASGGSLLMAKAISYGISGEEMARTGINDLIYGPQGSETDKNEDFAMGMGTLGTAVMEKKGLSLPKDLEVTTKGVGVVSDAMDIWTIKESFKEKNAAIDRVYAKKKYLEAKRQAILDKLN